MDNIEERNIAMTVLEATIEIAKASLNTTNGSYHIFTTEETTKGFVKGLTEIYKALDALAPKHPVR